MDVELQILKHFKRDAQPTVAIIDRYCEAYNDIFPEVRSYEGFKYLRDWNHLTNEKKVITTKAHFRM